MSGDALVGVLAAGSWGTALAQTLALAGHKVMVWDRDARVVDDINQRHENRKRYPGEALHENVMATLSLAELAKHCRVVIVAAPSDLNEELAAQLADKLGGRHVLVLASKGFRASDGGLLDGIWREACPDTSLCVLTGPMFARELMDRKVTAGIVASSDPAVRAQVADLFDVPFLRLYESDDMVGAQVGGALKNVLAVAAGVLDGLDFGANARAAMLARGLGEIARYARAVGGKEQTIWGLAGMGDVLLTATSTLSRNFRFGQMVGRGVAVSEAKAKVGTVEGILAARIVTVQAQALGIDLAIISAMDGILHGDVTPLRVVDYLMQRPRVEEFIA